ncbi:hypothetical protein AVEN_33030-1 [Araneus ventricosus]|uniref:Uncharacterized protein n=1 Tax=Araneus ventricosus TaxID=182803 RepID=A0A4Y2T403_ARAVE|nr:hypothetical protein AVEN_90200-1 [Araneus ventricosus]GBN95157.1 hypothetical protein AVEN_270191-1 [Araneus ventricosus]GBN95191.1 hypothetical protein AVEN_169085-1 [Araneus ventricosus]GBN95287.1 hypothetical protein AVEN_33030-1 [Araneus ventricosus]
MKYDSSRLAINLCVWSVGERESSWELKVRLEKSRMGKEDTRGYPVWVGVSLAGVGVGGEVRFGTSVNDLPKSIDWNEWNANHLLVQIEQIGLLVNAQLYNAIFSILNQSLYNIAHVYHPRILLPVFTKHIL